MAERVRRITNEYTKNTNGREYFTYVLFGENENSEWKKGVESLREMASLFLGKNKLD